MEAVSASYAVQRVLALEGPPGSWLLPGFDVVAQRPGAFGARFGGSHRRCVGPGPAPGARDRNGHAPGSGYRSGSGRGAPGAGSRRRAPRAVLGPAEDGGYWAIRRPPPRCGDVRRSPDEHEPHLRDTTRAPPRHGCLVPLGRRSSGRRRDRRRSRRCPSWRRRHASPPSSSPWPGRPPCRRRRRPSGATGSTGIWWAAVAETLVATSRLRVDNGRACRDRRPTVDRSR